MAKMSEHTIGVDISKFHLDVFRLEHAAAQRFDDSATGFRALTKWLNTTPVVRIVFAPTGPYHKAFEAAFCGVFPLVNGIHPVRLSITQKFCRRVAEAFFRRTRSAAVSANARSLRANSRSRPLVVSRVW